MSYDVVFIDWYVTLSRSHYWEQLRTENPAAYDLLSRWLLDHMGIFNNWMRGDITVSELAELQARDVDLPSAYIAGELTKSCQLLTYEYPEVLDEVERLREQGVRVVIATDNILEFSTITVPAQNILTHFDGVLNSAEVRHLKGDKVSEQRIPFFDDYLLRHNIPYRRAILIDDSDVYMKKYPHAPLKQVQVTDARHTIDVLRGL